MREFIFKRVNNIKGDLDLKAVLHTSNTKINKGILLYFHGGGFLYGNKDDLPKLHIDKLTDSGYSILSFDYRLAPEAEFSLILEDVLDAIEFFVGNRDKLGLSKSPYFLWGRSAGAYLALLASTKDLSLKPKGIISYYGYGLLIQDWYNTSSIYYLKYPKVSKEQFLSIIKDRYIVQGNISERYALYLYARQNGNWISIISKGNEDKFLKKYSLLNLPENFNFPPTFLAHSFRDMDVPFRESIELSKIIKNSTLFTCSAEDHDFDRNEKDKNTSDLLNKTIDFLDSL